MVTVANCTWESMNLSSPCIVSISSRTRPSSFSTSSKSATSLLFVFRISIKRCSIRRAFFSRDSVSKYAFVTSSVVSAWFFSSPSPRSFRRNRSRLSGRTLTTTWPLQFSVRLFFGTAGRDVTFLFRGESGDFLNGVFEANDFEFGRGVSDEFAIRGWAGSGRERTPRRFRSGSRSGVVRSSLVSFFFVFGAVDACCQYVRTVDGHGKRRLCLAFGLVPAAVARVLRHYSSN